MQRWRWFVYASDRIVHNSIEYNEAHSAMYAVYCPEYLIMQRFIFLPARSTIASYITYIYLSHNEKLQMCPDEAFFDMAVTK